MDFVNKIIQGKGGERKNEGRKWLLGQSQFNRTGPIDSEREREREREDRGAYNCQGKQIT